MRRFAHISLASIVFAVVIAAPVSPAFSGGGGKPVSLRELPAFSAPHDVLNLVLDDKILHVVSDDSLVTSVGSFPVFLIPGGPGHRIAIRTTERTGAMNLKVNAGCVGCGGNVGPVMMKVFGFQTKALPNTKRSENYEVSWNVPQGTSIYTGGLSGDNPRTGQATIPIDVLVLEKGIKLDFFEYDAPGGLKAERYIGTARSLDDRVLKYSFTPKKKPFLMAVANMGTETVAIEGDPVELRYVNEQEKSWPIGRASYTVVNKQVLVPGAFAVIDLSQIKDLRNAVYIHFRPGKRVEIAWGYAALTKNKNFVYSVAAGGFILLLCGVFFLKKRKAATVE